MRKIIILFIFFSLSINAQTIYRTPWFYPNSHGGSYDDMIDAENCYSNDGVYGYFLLPNSIPPSLNRERQQFYEFNIDTYFLDSTDICPVGFVTEMEYYTATDTTGIYSLITLNAFSNQFNSGPQPISQSLSEGDSPYEIRKAWMPLDTLDNNELWNNRFFFTDWEDSKFKPIITVFNTLDGSDTLFIDYFKIAIYYYHSKGWCHCINGVREPDSIMSVKNETDSLIQVTSMPR